MKLSAVVITKNEAANIGRCLKSVSFADEIVVIDSGSTDQTVDIAVGLGARVHSIARWEGYGKTKRLGVKRAAGEWILSIDADEVVSPSLASEIQLAIASGSAMSGYRFPRLTNFLGRWIRHCGWYPDYQLRLFRKDAGNFNEAVVHESVVLNGSVGRLQGDLLHYSDPTLEHYLVKFDRYTTLGAAQAHQEGRRAGWFDVAIRPIASFLSHYVIRRGFLDGLEGLVLSALSAMAVMVKYAKLRRLASKRDMES